MKDIFSVDYRDAVRFIVRKELKARYGIKIPKVRNRDKQKTLDDCQNKSKYFGVLLEKVPSKNIKDDQYFAVPTFLIDAFEYLKDHLTVEGLFRKSGSAMRQKILREIIERDGTFVNSDLLHPHDIASLVKQFFRELPNPLFTTQLSPVFLKCINLADTCESHDALFLCVLLLPDDYLRVLKYLVQCIHEVANHSLQSKMSIRNLGIVFAPNLLNICGKDINNEKCMKETTQIVDYIFKNLNRIGMVPDGIMEKATALHVDDGIVTSSGDEVDDNCRRGRTLEHNGERKRERSKSITGFLRRGFKSADKNSGKPGSNCLDKDIHGIVISPHRWVKSDTMQFPGNTKHSSSLVGSNGEKTNYSPIRKSPRLESDRQPVISLPILQTIPNQIAITPRNKLQNVEKICKKKKTLTATPVLPSKFDLSRAKNHSEPRKGRSNASRLGLVLDDQNEPPRLPQSRISRHTQKPHVKKSRRASSVDRRRARYQGSPAVRRPMIKTTMPDNSEISQFHDENLTANIAFMEDSNVPLNVDTLSFNVGANRSSHHSKIPKWKSNVNQSSNDSSDERLGGKSISNPDIVNLDMKNTKKGNCRQKVKKTSSVAERTVTGRFVDKD